jgi:hypothetical protein
MLLSKLTLSAAKPLTCSEKVLPTGPPFSHRQWITLPQSDSVPWLRFRLSLGVYWAGLLPGCLPHRQRWVVAPRFGTIAWYVRWET